MNYQKIKSSGLTLQLSDDFPVKAPSQTAHLFADGQRSSFEPLGCSKFARVFKFDLYLKGRIYSLILKQYLNRSLLDILKNFLRPSRAQRAFNAAQMLKQHGLSTPDIVAAGTKTVAGVTIKNFLITSYVKDSVPLPEMFNKETTGRDELIRQFGQTVGRMHTENIFHGDLRLGNVLVKKNNDKFEFIFLDNERTRKFEVLPWKLRLKNLVQVNMFRDNISDSDRTNFLDAYLEQQNIEIDKEKLADEVTARTNKRLAVRGISPKTV
jgi:tRNA A-37 threonylcarbamoyl transferase component Bud32